MVAINAIAELWTFEIALLQKHCHKRVLVGNPASEQPRRRPHFHICKYAHLWAQPMSWVLHERALGGHSSPSFSGLEPQNQQICRRSVNAHTFSEHGAMRNNTKRAHHTRTALRASLQQRLAPTARIAHSESSHGRLLEVPRSGRLSRCRRPASAEAPGCHCSPRGKASPLLGGEASARGP